MKSFSLRDYVSYRGMRGIVTFVDEPYIVITMPAVKGRDYPMLLVHTHRYDEVQFIRKNDV